MKISKIATKNLLENVKFLECLQIMNKNNSLNSFKRFDRNFSISEKDFSVTSKQRISY